ncbi:MAG: tRNA lysidine(34) synthetase TilS [Anaerolineae bacterium]|nr:MAG: tRNA lysidine(34) synthetase TilS [Anaerolineae bacterium]
MFPSLRLESGKLLVVGVSGGADSLALLHLLHTAGFPLLVAHFNHCLRPEAESDAAHVAHIAQSLNLPFVTASANVTTHAQEQGLSIEEAARELRYRFLFHQAREAGAQAVAVGHTADDQAETVLMHFLRGAGLSGLKGMTPRVILPIFDPHIPLVRPLLGWTRAQTESYCHQHHLPYLTDTSNADTTYFRNRLRHELLPRLADYNPQIRQTLAKSALALQGDYELLNEVVDSAWKKVLRTAGDGFLAFDLVQLRTMSPALRRNLFRRAAFALHPNLRDIDFAALERAATLKPTDLSSGLKTLIEGETLYVTEDEARLPMPYPQIYSQHVVAWEQNSVHRLLLDNAWELSAWLLTDPWPLPKNHWSAHFDADLTKNQLTVRPFQTGDRFEPLGMPGQTMKLSDLFINLKIPKRARKQWPVVCVGDEIAWIPGLRMSNRYRCTNSTRRVLALRVEKRDG